MPLAGVKARGTDLPRGWLRFVSMPYDCVVCVHPDGTWTMSSVTEAPEQYLKGRGWTEKEIDHGLGLSLP